MRIPPALSRFVRVTAVATIALASSLAQATPPRARSVPHRRPHHRTADPTSSAPPPAATAPHTDDLPSDRMVRFDLVGDDAAQLEAFASQVRAALGGMPDVTVLEPGTDIVPASARRALTGPMAHGMDATTNGWRVGTVANGDRRTDVVIRPPRPVVDNDPFRASRADYATGALSLNVALQFNDRSVGASPAPGGPRVTPHAHTIAFVLASAGRTLLPRSDVQEHLQRVEVPRGCEIVWH